MTVLRWLLVVQLTVASSLYVVMLLRLARMLWRERKRDRRKERRNGDLRARHPLLARMLWGMVFIVVALLCSFVGILVVLIGYWNPDLAPWRVPLWELEALGAFLGVLVFLRLEVKTELDELPIDLPERESSRP